MKNVPVRRVCGMSVSAGRKKEEKEGKQNLREVEHPR